MYVNLVILKLLYAVSIWNHDLFEFLVWDSVTR